MLKSKIQSDVQRPVEAKKENEPRQTKTFGDSVFEIQNVPVMESVLEALSIIGKHTEITISGKGKLISNAVTVALADGKIGREGIESYIEWWKNSVADRHDFTDYLRPFTMPVVMTDEDIDFIFGSVKGNLRSTLHAFTGGEILTAEIQSLIPMIQKKRPQLMNKIVKFGTTPLEKLLEEGIRTGYPAR